MPADPIEARFATIRSEILARLDVLLSEEDRQDIGAQCVRTGQSTLVIDLWKGQYRLARAHLFIEVETANESVMDAILRGYIAELDRHVP